MPCDIFAPMAKYKVVKEDSKKSRPRTHEDIAAQIIANHFKSDVIFIRRGNSKTPDLYIIKTNVRWELKSPIGDGKRNIQNNLRKAKNQSENIIIDVARSRLTEAKAKSRIDEYLRKESSIIKRIKIITKDGAVVDIRG